MTDTNKCYKAGRILIDKKPFRLNHKYNHRYNLSKTNGYIILKDIDEDYYVLEEYSECASVTANISEEI